MEKKTTAETQQADKKISPQSQLLADRWRDMLLVPPAERPEQIEPFKLSEYVRCCKEFLGKTDPVSDDDIKRETNFFRQIIKFHKYFPPNKGCCVTVVPFSKFGNPLEPMEIVNRDYLVRLFVDNTGRTAEDDSLDIVRMMPSEIQQQCGFFIENYNVNEASPSKKVSDEDREKIVQQYEKALRNLQKIFRDSQRTPLRSVPSQ